MLNFVDVSGWQNGIDISALQGVDCVITKATEGTGFINTDCDRVVQQCISLEKPWGFYHFAGEGGATAEADYFISNCQNYFNSGIPVLDWEGSQSVSWVNEFVQRVFDVKGVWCWIYANPWRFNQGGVNENCARWVASYPMVSHPTFNQAKSWDCPEVDGLVAAWQFCSDGLVNGYNGELDCNIYYGEVDSWYAYANCDAPNGGNAGGNGGDVSPNSSATLENDTYKVTIERK